MGVSTDEGPLTDENEYDEGFKVSLCWIKINLCGSLLITADCVNVVSVD